MECFSTLLNIDHFAKFNHLESQILKKTCRVPQGLVLGSFLSINNKCEISQNIKEIYYLPMIEVYFVMIL